jgi:hypothetical protein
VDEERTVDPPYAGCDCQCDPISAPNDDAEGIHKHPLRKDDRIDRDVHAEHKQERGGGEGQVGRDLSEGKERDKSGPFRVCQDTNQLENDGELRVVTSQSAGIRRQTMSRT